MVKRNKKVNGDNNLNLEGVLTPYFNYCHYRIFVLHLTISLIQNINSNMQNYMLYLKFL
jgi:hypothetical protein